MGAAAPMIAMAGLNVGAAAYQSRQIKAMGNYEALQHEFNAKNAEIQAADALRRGEKDVSTIRRSAKQVTGAQKVALAAQGVELDSGTPLDLVDDTKTLSAQDISTAKANAWRESFGYQVQASNYRMAGKMAKLGAKNAARNTMISGGLSGATSLTQAFSNNRYQRISEK